MKSITYKHYILGISLALLVAACGEGGKSDKKAELEKLKKERADLDAKIAELEKDSTVVGKDTTKLKLKEVNVLELQPRAFNHYVQTQGRVDAEDNILVSPKTQGVVTAVYVKEGQSVSKGQVLAQIDNSVIVSNIQAMEAQLKLATAVYERQKNLWDQKIGTEVQFLQAKATKENLEQQVTALRDQNDMTRIKSPINGTVDQVVAKIGQGAMPGQPAARVVNTSDLKLVAGISEAFVSNIKKGDKVEVTIAELNKPFKGTVTFVGKTIDLMSRTFPIEVKLPSDAALRPNMTAVIKVIYQTEQNAIVVPVNTIQTVNNEKIVYIAETKGNNTVARKKVVEVVGVFGDGAQVKGLNKGDKLVTVGFQSLSDGENIKI
ncbi:MAG TPA: efflux RND transporter periplasmic adaptor subunit [Cyclobacteriaceae bacterium]|nr:efflux RND transporter periplasmic adaptor subunit [Cyclobacteriaceae bacterium]HMV08595.1 efflux RND transporter periplasmic adaptor subunit [Cyclobacteriaceae bacterium]HMV91066.1 efflux RND transporter periplasmic adaptor subunit [Cyclobacteriaceae bacterium]HMX00196.1 efflux RND transporter periplasmic adaptor subunit [Cyclobacteriaceae bacterium]HMX49805.1 efflux RND transporter periplasmic adaptor subunit [Cyclobacteriaceae bacterium]